MKSARRRTAHTKPSVSRPRIGIIEPIRAGKTGPWPPLLFEMPAGLSRPPPETSSDAASRYRGASVWMIAQGCCPNHNSGGTERVAMSGMTAISAQLTEDDPVPGNKYCQAFLLPERRPASSLVREPNPRLSWHAAGQAFKFGPELWKGTNPAKPGIEHRVPFAVEEAAGYDLLRRRLSGGSSNRGD